MEDKYFYIKNKPTSYSTSKWAHLVKYNKQTYVTLDENIEWQQSIDIEIDKVNTLTFQTPKSSTFNLVKPIIKEVFFEYYYLALKYLSEVNFSDGEFYYFEKYSSGHTIAWYNLDQKQKQCLIVTLIDSVECFDLRVRMVKKWEERKQAIKIGKAIEETSFVHLFKSTLRFLYDPFNYHINFNSYLNEFKNIVLQEAVPTTIPFELEKNTTNIIGIIESRIKVLEKRLIESDSDTKDDRNRLRGEIDGLKFAISTMELN